MNKWSNKRFRSFKPQSILTQSTVLTVVLIASQLIAVSELVKTSGQSEAIAQKQRLDMDLMESLDRLLVQFALAWGSLLESLLQRNPAALQESLTAQEKLSRHLLGLNSLAMRDSDLKKLMAEFSFLSDRQTFMQRALSSPLVSNLSEEQYFKIVIETLSKRVVPFIRDFRQCQETVESFRNRHIARDAESAATRQASRDRVVLIFVLSCLGSNFAILWFIRHFVQRLKPLMTNAARMRLNKELEPSINGSDELSELDKVLVESSKYLYEAQRQRQQILDMIAHDIKSPLSSVKLLVERLSSSSGSQPMGVDNEKSFQQIERNLTVVLNLVGDFLENEKLRTGKFDLKFDEVLVQDLVSESLGLLSGQLTEKNLVVNSTICNRAVIVDRARLTQVLVNVISNAIKYSPTNGKIEIVVEACPLSTLFHVKDQGPGLNMQNSDIENVFDEYQQTQNSQPGYGLGLFISKKIVEAHGGKIWARNNSKTSRGATFSFELPNDNDEWYIE